VLLVFCWSQDGTEWGGRGTWLHPNAHGALEGGQWALHSQLVSLCGVGMVFAGLWPLARLKCIAHCPSGKGRACRSPGSSSVVQAA
jgi:hypothetical protein